MEPPSRETPVEQRGTVDHGACFPLRGLSCESYLQNPPVIHYHGPMALLEKPITHDTLIPLVAALIDAERRIAMLERRLRDARWLGPNEQPNEQDKQVAKQRVNASIGALASLDSVDSF